MPSNFFTDDEGAAAIQKVQGGYVLTIYHGGGGDSCTLLIQDSGAMFDMSGAPITRSDIDIARGYLGFVNGGMGVAQRLRATKVNPSFAAQARREIGR